MKILFPNLYINGKHPKNAQRPQTTDNVNSAVVTLQLALLGHIDLIQQSLLTQYLKTETSCASDLNSVARSYAKV